MKKQKRVISAIAIALFVITTMIAIGFGVTVALIYKDIDFVVDEQLFENSRSFESTLFYANAGDGKEYIPEAVETGGNIKKLHYNLDEISPYVSKGFIAVEDKKFYEHKGVDIKRTVLAAINLITRGEKTFGASTITQQVIKNVSGDNQVKIKRKISEIIRAIHVERIYSKDEIFETYLNVIPMGDNIYGVGAASRAYFGKEPCDLTAGEAATLIGITNAPTAYSPYLNPDKCKSKRNNVLSVLYKDGVIGEGEYRLEIGLDLSVIPRELREDRYDSWFVETAIDEISADLADKYDISPSAARIMLLSGGYKVYMTMDSRIQRIMEEHFENGDNLAKETENGLNYAMVITDTQSGDLLGIIGQAGAKRANRLLNHALVPHIPASTLKPIALYAPLIDEGRVSWSTVFDDVPVSFMETDAGYREYPKNSPDRYDGLITVKDAIRLSKNTVAVKLSEILTPKRIFHSLKDNFGFDSLVEREGGLSDIDVAPMALGQLCRGIPLIKMTEAYCVFPSDGIHHETRSYLYVCDHNGRKVLENMPSEKRVFSVDTARIMNQLLKNVTESGTAQAVTLKEITDVAGKTGTSGGNKDKLFIGYTQSLSAGIWCGYDDSSQIGSLSKGHIAVWDEVMKKIYEEGFERESFSTDGLLYLPYCKDSGKCYSDACLLDPRGSRLEYGYFGEKDTPKVPCDRHIVCMYDSLTKAVACENCPRENQVMVSLIKVVDRSFPKEIVVTDAEFVFRDVDRYDSWPIDYTLPYFQYSIPNGDYVGRSKGKKQFNSGCYLHDE